MTLKLPTPVAAYFIARFVLARIGRRAPPEVEEADWRPEAGPALQLLGEADALAAREREPTGGHRLVLGQVRCRIN